jgi:aspartyl-tRNA(Asn)/glutamyl-tRNA(Gln) amidotransferase subunit B
MELVFEPDLENGEEAAALVKELILILQRLGTCSCKMEGKQMAVMRV